MSRNRFPHCTSLSTAALGAVFVFGVAHAGDLPASPPAAEHDISRMHADYRGELGFLIEQGVAEPLSLATADFDEDGMPDLVVGYGDGLAGLVAVHRGNVEAVYPRPGREAGEAFQPVAEVFVAPRRAELVGAGDFDADGHFDVVVGTLGETALRLLRGDGAGAFAEADSVPLDGELTAMAVGEVNRRDGLADVVVGVDGVGGPHLLVFEWPEGALRGEPERVELDRPVTGVELARADDNGLYDIVFRAEHQDGIVRGRDRRLTSIAAVQTAILPARAEQGWPAATKNSDIREIGDQLESRDDVVAAVPMRLNRDAIPDLVAIVRGEPVPLVVKSLSRAVYTVDSTADDSDFLAGDGVCDTNDSVGDGPCTLRAAIEEANATAGADAVEFDIPGIGPHTIQPGSELPEVTETLTIDGFTQPGANANTVAFPGAMDSVLTIELDGINAGLRTSGIVITADSCTVRGLVINRWDTDSSHYGGHGIELHLASNNIVEGNYIGCDPTCTTQRINRKCGILMGGSSGNTVGGTAPAARNVISGNYRGVRVQASEALIQGNFFGTDPSGTMRVNFVAGTNVEIDSGSATTIGGGAPGEGNLVTGMQGFGVRLWNWTADNLIQGNIIGPDRTGTAELQNSTGIELDRASNTLIGGTAPGQGNLISGNHDDAIRVGDIAGAEILGNLIGVAIDGVTALDNWGSGIEVRGSGVQIGGTLPGSENIVAHNGLFLGSGVDVPWTTTTGVSILGNLIYGHDAQCHLGIDLGGDYVTPNDPGDGDSGANNLQNFPVVTEVLGGGNVVVGTLDSTPNTDFHLEFFANSACHSWYGHGEGELFLGSDTVTTDGAGAAAFASAVTTAAPIGSFVTATATAPDGSTSEFSACFEFTVAADLGITKDDGVTSVIPGSQVTYIIEASNAGPDDISGATVTDVFPAELSCSWTCVGSGGAACTAGPVAGDIGDTADLPVGGTATYTAVCDLDHTASGSLSNTAAVAAPVGATDPNAANDSATDIDTILELDYGDAPDPTYQTLFASDGARHALGGSLYLGSSVDADSDGQPTAAADGDDSDGSDDEDGVVFTSTVLTGLTASVEVTASAVGLLNAWVDFNADGDWLDAGEQIFSDEPLAAGINPLVFPVPAAAVLGETFARFRVDTAGGLAPAGLAVDGEVEDERLEVRFSAVEVPISGQTTSYSPGDDGAYHSGVPWPEPRFTDHGDGTMTDELTGLMWTQDNVTPGPAVCTPGIQKNWFDSLAHVDCLNANAYLGYTDWRMPNAIEIMSLANHEETDQRTWLASQGFTLTPWYYWWSSTTGASSIAATWVLGLDGTDGFYQKTNSSGTTLWPVRGSSAGSPAPLPKTGQIRCWNSSYSEIPCSGTGQDGDHRAGIEWPSPRFEVAGECVTDRLTGLMWTRDGSPFGTQNWWDALDSALSLDLCGYSDWRLPSRLEVKTLNHYDRRTGPVPPTMMEWWESQGFVNATSYQPWSGTSQPTNPLTRAFQMIGGDFKNDGDFAIAWPVRGNLNAAVADLSVELSDSPDPVAAGEALTYSVTASNLGPSTVDEVTITTMLDAGTVFVSASGSGWTCGEDSGVVTCTHGTLAVGPAPSISIDVTAPNSPGATLTSSALVDSPRGDPEPDNNAAEQETTIVGFDFGDAPDPGYPTLLASDGARHTIGGGLYLGSSIDGEADGQPSALADGDDLDGTDDEDGVVFTSGLGLGLGAYLEVEASAAGLLNAWVDFNADGDWTDAGEQIFTDLPVVAGINSLSFSVPAAGTIGPTGARFRIDSSGGLSPTGAASDGEVEDYLVEIIEGPDLEVEMTASAEPAPSGRPLTYTITVTNNGPLTATLVTVTDTLPGELIFVSSTPGSPDCTFSTGTVTCDLGTMAATGTAQITVETVLGHPVWGGFSNAASVTASETDPNPLNNTATVDSLIGIFIDGFENGTTDRWSDAVGG
jgi:uncharacterized repeat protein (TIGR01451 family)/CSLREA domain-containing protein